MMPNACNECNIQSRPCDNYVYAMETHILNRAKKTIHDHKQINRV